MTDIVLSTMGLPPTLTGTVLMTVTWLTGFNNREVLTRKQLALQVSKIFLIVMCLFFLMDLICAFISGKYTVASDIRYIIGVSLETDTRAYLYKVYYIVAALTVAMFYLVIGVRIQKEIKQMASEFNKIAGGTLPELVKILHRNMWLFGLLYGLWIIIAVFAMTPYVQLPFCTLFETSLITLQGRLFIYWLIYFLIALINCCHSLLVTTPIWTKDVSRRGTLEAERRNNSEEMESV
jgi:hypothetical protein